ncbi:MAG TPA: lytic transglycosylase domain-containing protein, partial [Myxococcota bacterium]
MSAVLRRSSMTTVAVVVTMFASLFTSTSAQAVPAVFEKPTAITNNVAFWKKVYAEWRLDDIALHDEEDLGMVYRVVRVPKRGQKDAQGRTRAEAVTQARLEVEAALKSLALKNPKNADELTGLEKDIFLNLAGVTRADKYTRLSTIRGQNGLYERFIQGYANSGLYERFIGEELERNGLPKELIGVAFVESLFFTGAKSKVGAAGVWQFMSYTGKEYMQLNPVVDERWDPILATEAASKYLKQAYKELGTWPLAITSYNYGRGGMKALKNAAGTGDFNTILAVTKGKRFGFAGRNYYASFLAILEILDEKEARLAGVEKRAPWDYDVVRVPYPLFSTQIVATGLVDQATFEWLNPALSDDAARGRLPLPHGMSLRVPREAGAPLLATLNALDAAEKLKASRAVKLVHTANGKQSLKDIAKAHGLGVDVLAARTGLPHSGALPKGS